MTRNRLHDYEALKREYIFDPTPGRGISLTDLAEKHGMARSLLADRAVNERWYDQRTEFREQMGMKVVEALGENWVKFETATRQKMMDVGIKYLDKYAEALANNEIKVNTRDALGVASMLRTLVMDAASTPAPDESLIDPENSHLDPEEYRRALRTIEQLESGQQQDDADGPPPTSIAGTRPH